MSHVLLVEDDRDMQDLLVKWVRALGHDAVAFGTAGEAHDWATRPGAPAADLAVLDYSLPDLDGVDLLARLRESRPDLAAMFVTVLWSGEVIERIRSTGCQVLAKPFGRRQLHDAIVAALAGPDDGELPA